MSKKKTPNKIKYKGAEYVRIATPVCKSCGHPMKMGYPGNDPENGPARSYCPKGCKTKCPVCKKRNLVGQFDDCCPSCMKKNSKDWPI